MKLLAPIYCLQYIDEVTEFRADEFICSTVCFDSWLTYRRVSEYRWPGGAQIPVATSPWRLNFVQWHLIFVDPRYVICFLSPFCLLYLWGVFTIFVKCVHSCWKRVPVLCVVPSGNPGSTCNIKSLLWCFAFSADGSCAGGRTIVCMLVFYSPYQNCWEDTITWTGVLYGIGHTTRHNWIRAIPIIIIVIVARSLIT